MTAPGPSSRRLRILQVVGSLDRGGAETWLIQCLRALDRERYRFDFVVDSARPGAYDAEARAMGAEVIVCPYPVPPWSYARALRRILDERVRYDVVHAHLYLFSALPLWVARRAGLRARIAHLYPVTDTRSQTPARRVYRAAASRFLAHAATTILTDSESGLQASRQLVGMALPIQVVRPGIDLAPFTRTVDRSAVRSTLGLPQDRPLLTYVARFAPHKNHAQLLRIAARWAAQGRPAHFALAGSHGPLLARVRAEARALPNVSVLMGLPSIAELLLASDVLLMPSLEEGFGIVVVEAAAAGLPVVATDLPALRETVSPSCRTLLFAAGDDQAAETSLRAVLDDPVRAATLAADARAWAAGFAIERSAAALASAYDDAVPR